MNRNDTARLRSRLQQIIDEAQTSSDYSRTNRNRSNVHTEAKNIIGIHDSMIVHCNAFAQPVSFR